VSQRGFSVRQRFDQFVCTLFNRHCHAFIAGVGERLTAKKNPNRLPAQGTFDNPAPRY
jgi:hypothetical protein